MKRSFICIKEKNVSSFCSNFTLLKRITKLDISFKTLQIHSFKYHHVILHIFNDNKTHK